MIATIQCGVMNSTHLHKAYRPEETISRGFYWEYKYIRNYDSIVATKIHKERVIYAKKKMKQRDWQINAEGENKFKNQY